MTSRVTCAKPWIGPRRRRTARTRGATSSGVVSGAARGGDGDSLAARGAALASARAAVDVPDQPSVLRMAAELRSAATRAARAGDAENALAALFDAFVEDIERGFEASRASRKKNHPENESSESSASRGGEASNDGEPEDAVSREDAARELRGSERGPNAVARGASQTSPRTSPEPRKEDPEDRSADVAVASRSDRPSNVAPNTGGGGRGGAATPTEPCAVSAGRRRRRARSARPSAEAKGRAVSKKLTLRLRRTSPPAAAAAAAARSALASRAPFATDETYDFLFDRGYSARGPRTNHRHGIRFLACASIGKRAASPRRSRREPSSVSPVSPRRRPAANGWRGSRREWETPRAARRPRWAPSSVSASGGRPRRPRDGGRTRRARSRRPRHWRGRPQARRARSYRRGGAARRHRTPVTSTETNAGPFFLVKQNSIIRQSASNTSSFFFVSRNRVRLCLFSHRKKRVRVARPSK